MNSNSFKFLELSEGVDVSLSIILELHALLELLSAEDCVSNKFFLDDKLQDFRF